MKIDNCPNCGRRVVVEPKEMFEKHLASCSPRAEEIPRQEVEVPEQKQALENIFFSDEGKKVVDELKRLHPLPVLLIGRTGMGKSILARYVASELCLPYSSINAHPGMNISLLVGMWKPKPAGSGVTVEWSDGVLTDAIRRGRVFLFEELTRSPQEAMSRLFGLMDNGFRYWSLPEHGSGGVEVHPKFWLIATANPVGGGYYTAKLDKALEDRFIATFRIEKPLADEPRVLSNICGEPLAERIMRFAEDARSTERTYLSTRDIVFLAELSRRGFSLRRAVEISIAPKFKEEDGKALMNLAEAHF